MKVVIIAPNFRSTWPQYFLVNNQSV